MGVEEIIRFRNACLNCDRVYLGFIRSKCLRLTQADMSQIIGCGRSSLAKFEAGKRPVPQWYRLTIYAMLTQMLEARCMKVTA